MKHRSAITFLLFIAILTGCGVTYDQLYLRNPVYQPPPAPPIRFDGYYYWTIATGAGFCRDGRTPYFFYPNGTVLELDNHCSHELLIDWILNDYTLHHYHWGTFMTYQDSSIICETYSPNSGTRNYDRSYLVGKAYGDSIEFTHLINRMWEKHEVEIKLLFQPSVAKPDISDSFFEKDEVKYK